MPIDDTTLSDLMSLDRRRRRRAAKRLTRTPRADAVPLLIDLLEDEHEDVRSSALVALAASRDPRGRDAAVEILGRDDEDEFVQREALFVLGASADDSSREELAKIVTTSPSSMLRNEAGLIIKDLHDPPPLQ